MGEPAAPAAAAGPSAAAPKHAATTPPPPTPHTQLPKPPLPPPFQEGKFKTPSGRVGPQGAPTLRQHYDTILLEVEAVRAAIDEVGGARWKEVLAAEPEARAAAELMARRP